LVLVTTFELNLTTIEANNNGPLFSGTPASVAKLVIEPPSVMHPVGRKARQHNQAVKPHSAIVLVERLDQLIPQEAE
jgi:hypothetical protein